MTAAASGGPPSSAQPARIEEVQRPGRVRLRARLGEEPGPVQQFLDLAVDPRAHRVRHPRRLDLHRVPGTGRGDLLVGAVARPDAVLPGVMRSEEHTSELQSQSFISYAVF